MSAPFNMFSWSADIPLCDDTWLGMQARNIAIVDLTIIRDFEEQTLAAYMERERTPIDMLLPLSALSQMWCFSLYEFLRTWRQRAGELVTIATAYNKLPHTEKETYLASEVTKAKLRNKHAHILPSTFSDHVAKLSDFDFYKSLEIYRDATEEIFREVEALRVTLAKHEVPKTKGMFAEAPGYCRMSYKDGSVYWPIVLKNDELLMVNRRELADAFMGIEDGYDVEPDDEANSE
jgi:hypothetical protein